MFVQSDKKWSDIEMVKGVSIGEFGCLLTSITNVLCLYNKKYAEYMTPDILNTIVQNNKGYTSNGLIIWGFLEFFFGFKHRNIGKSKPIFTDNIFNIVHIPYKNTGHFSNLFDFCGKEYKYIDTFDGTIKKINVDKIISVRQINFGG